LPIRVKIAIFSPIFLDETIPQNPNMDNSSSAGQVVQLGLDGFECLTLVHQRFAAFDRDANLQTNTVRLKLVVDPYVQLW
jgi:hypothetical protein